MPLELFNTHHDLKKDYHWYIDHPDAFKRVMANRRRDAVHHFRHLQIPKKQPVENPSEQVSADTQDDSKQAPEDSEAWETPMREIQHLRHISFSPSR